MNCGDKRVGFEQSVVPKFNPKSSKLMEGKISHEIGIDLKYWTKFRRGSLRIIFAFSQIVCGIIVCFKTTLYAEITDVLIMAAIPYLTSFILLRCLKLKAASCNTKLC